MPGVAHSVVLLPWQMTFVPVIAHTGSGFSVSTPEPVPVQPFASVTVTVYVPAALTVMFDVLAPLFHEYPNGGVPLLTVAVNVAGILEHTVAEFTFTTGFGLTISVPEHVVSQPLVSVAVTM
jgi:hypothetical protein